VKRHFGRILYTFYIAWPLQIYTTFRRLPLKETVSLAVAFPYLTGHTVVVLHSYGLFNDVSSPGCILFSSRIIREQWIRRDAGGIGRCRAGLRENTKNLSQDILSPDLDFLIRKQACCPLCHGSNAINLTAHSCACGFSGETVGSVERRVLSCGL
jgi:hypothetical protein